MNTALFNEIMTDGKTLPPRPGQRIRVVKGLPEGAKLDAISMDLYFALDQIALKYSHPSWDETPANQAIPVIDVQYVIEDELKPCPDCGYRPGDRGAVATGGEPDAPDSYDPGDGQDHEAADEPDEYTHFAGTVVSGGGAYEVWGKHEVDQDQLAACFP